jgi:hypothetical protein
VTGLERGTSKDASYRVPYWPLFLGTFLACCAVITFEMWEAGSLFVASYWSPGRWVVGVACTVFISWEVCEELTRVVYRVNLHDRVLYVRSTLIWRELPVEDLTAISWGQRNHSYILRRRKGRPLYLWSAKGVYEFLRVLGQERPDLQIDENLWSKRVEKDIGRSGFSGG